MSNELGLKFSVSIPFQYTDLPANATTDMILALGGTGWVVPAGYTAHAVGLCIAANTAVTAQTITGKVIDDGTEIVNGPEPQLTTSVQRATALARPGVQPIAAGSVVGVSLTTPSGFTPVTLDADAILHLVLTPAV